MFRPKGRDLNNPAVKHFLSLDISAGGCNRKGQKVKSRKTWYLCPSSGRVDGYVSGMCYKSLWVALADENETLEASNTLYTIRFTRSMSLDQKAALCLGLLTRRVLTELSQVGRRYADGLMKYEPGDLHDIRIPLAKHCKSAFSIYCRAIKLILAGKGREATVLADEFLLSSIKIRKPRSRRDVTEPSHPRIVLRTPSKQQPDPSSSVSGLPSMSV